MRVALAVAVVLRRSKAKAARCLGQVRVGRAILFTSDCSARLQGVVKVRP
eukprot:COSAG02_NODE_57850_length_279_cov_0.711111_1_plen_49_part_01